MSSIKIIKGDLLLLAHHDWFDVIGHGCNCQNTMGAGIAKQIKLQYPDAFEADLKTIKGDGNKLGSYSFASVLSQSETPFDILNIYTQEFYRGKPRGHVYFDYKAFDSAMAAIAKAYAGKRLGLPRIGSGLAGGCEKKIQKIIEKYSDQLIITIVEFPS